MAAMKHTAIRLSADDLAALDKARGNVDRSAFVRSLIRNAGRRRRRGRRHKLGSPEHAMELLAEAAEHDARAAVEYARVTRADAELKRLRGLTD